ncbi:hypothetical protein JCM6292_2755 [Bacteroides pyogenes JCM 6292]|uniref:Uncharacterized protein n=2 Tax=Bacteroides pyogenes TaxID=310300 RepID=W4PJC0_9BACE|nr:hypothetical protein JCM6292_2755 [Bacteroides pyogenes JCM 6292]GAE19800.1 hypothetical protein JCM6294_2903 [Bacteroides pyogenes DSM 20611 = JCM 6294]
MYILLLHRRIVFYFFKVYIFSFVFAEYLLGALFLPTIGKIVDFIIISGVRVRFSICMLVSVSLFEVCTLMSG